MITWQDFEKKPDKAAAVKQVIDEWVAGEMYRTAQVADLYNKQKNKTICEYMRIMYTLLGDPVEDFIAANNKICSNFFHRLNIQRNTYSLGNGVSFAADQGEDGKSTNKIKNMFGPRFDTTLQEAGFKALIHGLSFLYLGDKVYCFPVTEFAPLWDERTQKLMGGVRFWRIDEDKPLTAILFTKENKIRYRSEGADGELKQVAEEAYIYDTETSEAFGEEIVGESHYPDIPIVPLWGSNLHQSTLVGMQTKIDAFDLVRSGFANDLQDCAQIYWLIENYGGMDPEALQRFRNRLKLHHIVETDTSQGGKVTPFTQDVPYAARKTFLDDMRAGIYEDFGALDVHTVAAGATNDHIDAAYQPMDEEADDFEKQIIECVQSLGVLLGIDEEDAIPIFKRNRLSNQSEQVQMIATEAQWLDHETILRKLPNITVDEVQGILQRAQKEEADKMLADLTMANGTAPTEMIEVEEE